MLAVHSEVAHLKAAQLGKKHALNMLWRPYVGSERRPRQIPAGTPVTYRGGMYRVGTGGPGTFLITIESAKALLNAGMLQ